MQGPPRGLSRALLATAVVGALGLIATEFLPLIEVRGPTLSETVTGHDHHNWALIPLGLAALVLTAGLVRAASRPLAGGLLAVGLVALAIALLADVPDLRETGLLGSGAALETAKSEPQVGFYAETLASVLLILSGGTLLLLGAKRGGATRGEPAA